MDFNFSNLVTILSAFAGLLSVFGTLTTFVRNKIKEKRALGEINETVFVEAISSSNIKKLGNYLDKNLGGITIREYTSNKQIQYKVNNYLQNIISYVGTQEEIKKGEVPIPDAETSSNSEVPYELLSIITNVRVGQIWNALAELRKHIEIRLRTIIEQFKIETIKSIPPTQMLSMLSSLKIISPTAARNLKYAISVCNKAIHGLDTTQEEAEEAIQLAIKGLDEIKRMKR